MFVSTYQYGLAAMTYRVETIYVMTYQYIDISWQPYPLLVIVASTCTCTLIGASHASVCYMCTWKKNLLYQLKIEKKKKFADVSTEAFFYQLAFNQQSRNTRQPQYLTEYNTHVCCDG